MKHTIRIILFLFTLVQVISARAQEETPIMNKPNPDQLLERLKIELTNGPPRVYAFTDHVGGFWEGQTFDDNTNFGGYSLDGRRFLSDFVWIKAGNVVTKTEARTVEMWPHQFRRQYAEMAESLTVLTGQHGLLIQVSNPGDTELLFVPTFCTPSSALTVESHDTSTIFHDSESERFMALSTNMTSEWLSEPDLPEFPQNLTNNKSEVGALKISAKRDASAPLTVMILFGQDRAQLLAEVEKLQKTIETKPNALVEARKQKMIDLLLDSYFETNLPEYDKALHWNKITGNDLVVRQFGTGIWAGLPWFHQSWGRDTFIALPGISLVTGQFDDAREIIETFATYQKTDPDDALYGRVPNRVNSPTDIIYNTTDGTPWLIREIYEYVNYTGDMAFAEKMFPVINLAIEGALQNFVDADGFLTHADADTWMDAKIEGKQPWSPRGDRAVDIQALWYNQLKVSADLARRLGHPAEAEKWETLAAQVKTHFQDQFVDDETNALHDHLNPDNTPDTQIRPNQMFALTIPMADPLVEPKTQAGVVQQVVSELTLPYGVLSLAQDDPYFHPYHHDQIYHFDAAYHNGLCWHWNLGAVVGGMCRVGYDDMAFRISQNLAEQTLHTGMPGALSELVEPLPREDGSLVLTGTYSQAWSMSEFVRNFYQDFLGLHPNMLAREVVVAPHLPDALTDVRFVQKIGQGEELTGHFEQSGDGWHLTFSGTGLHDDLALRLRLKDSEQQVYETQIDLPPAAKLDIHWPNTTRMALKIADQTVEMSPTDEHYPLPDPNLKFQTARLPENSKPLTIPNYLEDIRRAEYPD